MGAVALEQRAQRGRELGPQRDVGTGVGTVSAQRRAVVVAQDAGVQLHDEAVLAGHARHLVEHVRANAAPSCLRGLAAQRRGEDPPRGRVVEALGRQPPHAVVARRRAERGEVAAALLERRDEVVVGADRACRAAAARRSTCAGQPGPRDVEQRVGTERRDDAAIPARVRRERVVVAQVVRRVVGRREDLDAEALVERARAQLRLREALRELVEQLVGGGRGRRDPHVEHVVQDELEPEPHDGPGQAAASARTAAARSRAARLAGAARRAPRRGRAAGG